MNADFYAFVRELVNETRNGHLRWGNSSVKDEYKLELQAGVLMITCNNSPVVKYTLHLFRSLGNDQILCEATPSDMDYHILSELYSCARSSLSVTISELRAEISSLTHK